MKVKLIFRRWLFVLGVCRVCTAGVAAPLILQAEKPGAIYQPGERITWRATLAGGTNAPVDHAAYVVRQGGAKVIGQGRIDLSAGAATIQASLGNPGTLLVDVTVTNAGAVPVEVLAGAAIAPDKIPVSAACPGDFDEFWKTKLAELAQVPENPQLTPASSGRAGVSYSLITLDNIRGTHIRGQVARPVKGRKFPAMLMVQWAGVYPLQKAWVTDRAAEGWLVLNITAHDLPIDRPAAFYEDLAKHALTNYTARGNDDREQSYFLRMFLACARAVDYLAEQPDWDGRTLVVTGTSQGGLQSFVAAGLNHKVTALMALVPAGCDNTGDQAGRKPGWPYWLANTGSHDPVKVRETARYFDGVNFAARVSCPALIGMGLIDTTSPPSGVFAAINQLKGPKEVVVMPGANHHGDNKTHVPFEKRAAAWRAALVQGRPVPLNPEFKGSPAAGEK